MRAVALIVDGVGVGRLLAKGPQVAEKVIATLYLAAGKQAGFVGKVVRVAGRVFRVRRNR